jgi:hypothetical protein
VHLEATQQQLQPPASSTCHHCIKTLVCSMLSSFDLLPFLLLCLLLCSCVSYAGTATETRQLAQALRGAAEVQEGISGSGSMPLKAAQQVLQPSRALTGYRHSRSSSSSMLQQENLLVG